MVRKRERGSEKARKRESENEGQKRMSSADEMARETDTDVLCRAQPTSVEPPPFFCCCPVAALVPYLP